VAALASPRLATKTVRLWDAETGKPLKGHQGDLLSAEFASMAGTLLPSVEGKRARLWKISANTQELVPHAKAGIPSASPNFSVL
jgi:WD40 repeat protein